MGPPVSSISGHGCPGCRKPRVFCLQRRALVAFIHFRSEKGLLCTNWSPSWQPPVTAPILGGEAEFCVERRESDRWPWSRAENSWITAFISRTFSPSDGSQNRELLSSKSHRIYLIREKFLTPATQSLKATF